MYLNKRKIYTNLSSFVLISIFSFNFVSAQTFWKYLFTGSTINEALYTSRAFSNTSRSGGGPLGISSTLRKLLCKAFEKECEELKDPEANA